LLIRLLMSYTITNMGDEEKIMEEVRADLLFAQPSFWSGLGRWLDLTGCFDFYNISPDGETADARALYSDWRAVGQELRSACASHAKEIATRQGLLFAEAPWQSRDDHDRRRTAKTRIAGSLQR
jgi:hypothetical protein